MFISDTPVYSFSFKLHSIMASHEGFPSSVNDFQQNSEEVRSQSYIQPGGLVLLLNIVPRGNITVTENLGLHLTITAAFLILNLSSSVIFMELLLSVIYNKRLLQMLKKIYSPSWIIYYKTNSSCNKTALCNQFDVLINEVQMHKRGENLH